MTHVTCFFVKYQIGAIADHCFNLVTLVKLLTFVKLIFTAAFQVNFQSFYEWFIDFKAHDTRYLNFVKYLIRVIVYYRFETIT